jgi:leader peptidase (prepilin peptidase)/N-methyltransferase
MGMGDVKLAGVLGMGLAWLGWSEWLVGAFLAFLLGAVVGLGLMLLRRASRRSAIPFGPFMVAGALLGILVGPQIADWYAGLITV